MSTKIVRWQEMIKTIHKDAESLLDDHRNIYKSYVEMINASPDSVRTPFDFHSFVRRQHGLATAMFIRRQIDTKNNSLYRLLYEMEKNPEIITIDSFKELYHNSSWASNDFARFTEDGKTMSSRIIKKDRVKLLQLGQRIGKYASEQLAHRSSNVPMKITYNELDDFLNTFEDLLSKYLILLTGSGYSQIAPIYQYDWMQIFKHPWLK